MVRKGYFLEDFEDAFRRYLPSQNATPQQPLNDKNLEQNQNATDSSSVADQNGHKSSPDNDCRGVAFQEGGKGETTSKDVDDEPPASSEEETEWTL